MRNGSLDARAVRPDDCGVRIAPCGAARGERRVRKPFSGLAPLAGALRMVGCVMSKQFATFYVTWRDAPNRPLGLFMDDAAYGRAASKALEAKINDLAQEGWILDRVIPATGFTAKQTSAFTIVAFK